MQMVKGNPMPKRELDAYIKERMPDPPKPSRTKKQAPKKGAGRKRKRS